MFDEMRIGVKQVIWDRIYHEIEACTKPRYYEDGYDNQLMSQHILLDKL